MSDYADSIDTSEFKYTREVYFHNTNSESRINYPVKLILTEDNFNFDLAQDNGFDFRLAERSNGSGVLKMWVASWSKDDKHAVLWFKIPYLSPDPEFVFYTFWGSVGDTSVFVGDTWNSLDKSGSITLSNDDLTSEAFNDGSFNVRSTKGVSSGKWYWEVTIDIGGSWPDITCVCIGDSDISLTTNIQPGSSINGYEYAMHSGKKGNSNVYVDYGDSYTTGDVIGTALDLDNGKIWWAKNGIWQAGGDPTAGLNEAYNGIIGAFYPIANFYVWGQNRKQTVNFGMSAFSYTVPIGFIAGYGIIEDDISTPEELNFLFYEDFETTPIDSAKWTGMLNSSITNHGYLFPSNLSFTTTTNPLIEQNSWIIEAGVYLVNDNSCDLNDRSHGIEFIGDENGFIINIMHDTRVEHNAVYQGGSTYQNINQIYGGLEQDSYQEHYIAYYEPEDRIYQRISNRASYEDIENKIDRKVEGDTRINNVRVHGRQVVSATDGAYPSYINWFVIREYDNLNLANLDGSELYVKYENVEHQTFDHKDYTEDLTSIDYIHNSSFGGNAYKISNNITSDAWYSDEEAVLQSQVHTTIYFDRIENLVSTGRLHYNSNHEKFYGAVKMSDSDLDVHGRDHWRAESTNAWAIISFDSDRPIVNVFGIRAVSDDLDSCPNNYKFYGGLEPYHASFKLLHEGSFTKTAEWQSVTFINKNPYKYYKFEIIDTYGNDIKVQEWLMYEYVGIDKPKYISQLRLHPADFGGLEDNFPKQISLEGSNDMLNWEIVMPLTNTYTPYISHNVSYGKWQRYSFTNIKGYWHYRLACKDNWGASDGRIIIGEWEMCELKEESNIHRILAGSTNNIEQIWASDTCGFEDDSGLIYIGNEKLNIVQSSKLIEEKDISEFYDDINVV